MYEVVGYSYTGIDSGGVVVIYWVGCTGEYRNNLLMGGLVVDWWYYRPKRAKVLLS